MLRTFIVTLCLLVAWTLVVVGVVAVESIWFAEPSVIRGDIKSMQNHLHTVLDQAAVDRSLGAAALAVIHNGNIVFDHGYASVGENPRLPVDAETTLFQVGSVSKAVTAFGVMNLVEDGKLDLDEPVVRRMKRWRFAGSDDRKDRITARHLLSHTAGIEDPPGYTGFSEDERQQTLEEYLSGVEIVREPGTEFGYGNAASAVLQLLIEDITGETFPDYMEANVLRPLGMTNSTFDLQKALPHLAPAYDSNVVVRAPRRHSIPAAVALYVSGRDLARFAQALGGANPVLSEETMRSMARPAPSTGGGWGLGLALFTGNDAEGYILGHDGGAVPSWGAMVRFNPATRNGMVAAISGGRGAANQLSHDWVYWETGVLTTEARRQFAYGRIRPALGATGIGGLFIAMLMIMRHRTRASRAHTRHS